MLAYPHGVKAAPEALTVQQSDSSYLLNPHLEFFIDETAELSFSELLQVNPVFKTLPSEQAVHNFGYQSGAYWARFTVHKQADAPSEWLFEMTYPYMQYVDLYIPESHVQGEDTLASIKNWEHKKAGLNVPFNQWEIPHHHIVFKLDIKQDSQTFYLRFKNHATMTLPLYLWGVDAFIEYKQYDYLFLGLLYGALIIMIAYNLLLFAFLEDRSYAYYVWFIIAIMLFQGTLDGFIKQYVLQDNAYLLSLTAPFLICLIGMTSLRFTSHFLRMSEYTPRLHRVMVIKAYMWLGFLCFVPFVDYQLIMKVLLPFAILTMLLMLYASARVWWQGYHSARYFVAALACVIIGTAIAILVRFTLIPSTSFTEEGPLLGAVGMAVLLALALADRINIMRAEQEFVQNALLHQQEAALRLKENYNRSLETRVRERTVALERAKQTLEQTVANLKSTQDELVQTEKMAALGQLLAGVAHEINTPLGAIRASISNIRKFISQHLQQLPRNLSDLQENQKTLFFTLLDRGLVEERLLSSKEERYCRRALARELEQAAFEGDVSYCAELLVDMHIYDKIEGFIPLLKQENGLQVLESANAIIALHYSAGTAHLATDQASKVIFALKNFTHYGRDGEKIEANLTEGIETVLTLYHNQIKQGVDVVRHYEEVPLLKCYPDELHQVWTNLIHNALQAMDGEGTLTIMVTQAENHVLIHISDTGCGMSEEVQAKMFDVFFTTKPAGVGSGLGLDIVQRIVRKHQGSIEVKSKEGEGSMFTVSLPIA